MIRRFQQVLRIGRFKSLSHSNADELALRRLSLIYARNGSGKSTLSELLRSASKKSDTPITTLATLGEETPPQVTLAFHADGGHQQVLRFDGTSWSGPDFLASVFDRTFIEDNLFVGRVMSKEHRAALLQVALGEAEAIPARRLRDVKKKSRELTAEAKTKRQLLSAMAKDFGLTFEQFLDLTPAEDLTERIQAAEDCVRASHLAQEITSVTG